MKETLTLPKSPCGMGVSSFKHIVQKMLVQNRYSMLHSANDAIQQVWTDTSSRHIDADRLIVQNESLKSAQKVLKGEQKTRALTHLQGLQLQALTVKAVTSVIVKSNIVLWSDTVEYLSAVLYNFARKAMLQVLPTASNLVRWGRMRDASCPLCSCGKVQTNKHVLPNCSSVTALHGYTTRHNDVLKLLVEWLRAVLPKDKLLYADLDRDIQYCQFLTCFVISVLTLQYPA